MVKLRPRKPIDHDLKCWPLFFEPMITGAKPFESRRNDRDFMVGDTLILREWCPDRQEYTMRVCRRTITYKLHGEQFGILTGYVVLGIAKEATL